MARKIIVPLGFVPFQADPFPNSREGSLGGGWVLRGGGQTPTPTIFGQDSVQEGGCWAGQPVGSSQVLILLIPAFTLAGGKPMWAEGSGMRCLPLGGVHLPQPGFTGSPEDPSLLAPEGAGGPALLSLGIVLEERGSRALPRRISPPSLQIPASLGTSGKNKPCPAAFARRRGLAGTQAASAERRCGGPRPWGGASGWRESS